MDQKFIIVINCHFIQNHVAYKKLISQKFLFPLGSEVGFINTSTKVTIKYRDDDGNLRLYDNVSIQNRNNSYLLKSEITFLNYLSNQIPKSQFLFIFIEGSSITARAIFYFDKQKDTIFDEIENNHPTIRLGMFDLPPAEICVIDTPQNQDIFFKILFKIDQDLFSLRAERFLKNPHILTYLFSHVMSVSSKEHINYISQLRIISDHLREFLKSKIKKIDRNHNEIWSKFYGSKISFVDGGMSRIVSLPGTEPMGIRVGIYSVIPGESNLEEREEWNLYSYVIGDVLSDKELIESDIYQIDIKRLQEAARYILEPLTSLDYLSKCSLKPDVLLMHGPLQNAFETYDERDPYYIPGVDKEFLSTRGITEMEIIDYLLYLPKNGQGKYIWNGCIAVYAYIMNKIKQTNTPVVGVVERAHSTNIIYSVLDMLVEESMIPESTKRKLWNIIKKNEIWDEILFGCILEEGEYLQPIKITKNLKRRGHDQWKPIIEKFPPIYSTMLKTSPNNFPFRVELNNYHTKPSVHEIMGLLYHTALLLPNYAFPVGLDIADKYAKIPDWLSKGISARLTANILNRVLQTGNDRMLRQVRQLLARSPRDFFYRPKI